jgi:O-antigen/teichoic acid export membrane protein
VTIAANVRALGLSQVLSKAAGFVSVVVFARVLVPADFGRYTVALALVSLLAVAVELGTSGYLVREGAQRPETLGRVLGHVLLVRAALGVAAMAVVVPLAGALGYDRPTTILIELFTAATAVRLFGSAMLSALQSVDRLRDVASLQARSALAQAAAMITVVALGGGLTGAGWAMLATALLLPVWAAMRLRRRWNGRITFGLRGMPRTLRATLVFGLSAGLGTMLTYLDSLMIHGFLGQVETARYGAAYRVVLALEIVPVVVTEAVSRTIAHLAHRDRAAMALAFRRSLGHLLMAAVPAAVGGALLAGPVLRTLFGPEYVAAGPAFALLCATMVLAFPGGLAVTAAYAIGEERRVLGILALGVAANVAANLVVIPRFGIAGAAAATVGAEALILVLVLRRLRAAGVGSGIARALWRPALAATAMAAVVVPLRDSPIVLPLLAGAVVYGVVLGVLMELGVRAGSVGRPPR